MILLLFFKSKTNGPRISKIKVFYLVYNHLRLSYGVRCRGKTSVLTIKQNIFFGK